MRYAPRPNPQPASMAPGCDAGLVKLFRLLRLARRLLNLETGAASSNPGHGA